jgi:hypothetical protein
MSRLARRALLQSSASLALAPLSRAAATPDLTMAPVPPDSVLVQANQSAGSVKLPAARCRILRQTRLGGLPAALISFAADRPPAIACDLLAVAGDDGTGLRLLALEPLTWRDGSGAHLATRLSLVPDGRRVLLMRDAAAPRGGTLTWRRESWSDLLAWVPGVPLVDAAVRQAPPGTWQAALAATRAVVRSRLQADPDAVTPEMVALVTPSFRAQSSAG